MDRHDRLLYHQIHPLKLVTDVTTAAVAAVAFWHHAPFLAFAIGFGPSVLVTVALVTWAKLDRYAASAFGRYIRRFMTRRVEAARLAGLIPLWGGAWAHRPVVMGFGGIWILCCWLWGLRSVESHAPAA